MVIRTHRNKGGVDLQSPSSLERCNDGVGIRRYRRELQAGGNTACEMGGFGGCENGSGG